MLKPNQNIKKEEQIALDNYIAERKKLSDEMCQKISKSTHIENVFGGLASGAILGLVFGLLFSSTVGKKPVFDENKHVIEYKTDYKELSKSLLIAIATMLSASLAFAELKTYMDAKTTHIWTSEVSNDIFKRMFNKSLQQYVVDEKVQTRAACAAALILNNMPPAKLETLRELAMKSFITHINGDLSINDTYVEKASNVISDYINMNTELGYNILRIMRGDEPSTYFLPGLQKTR